MAGFRLSPPQRRLFAIHGTDDPGLAHCVARLDGPLDRDRLRRAVERVVAEYEILRTTFRPVPAMKLPVQVIGDGTPVTYAERDSGDDPDAPATWADLIAGHEPFDLAAGPLLRVTVAGFGPDRHALAVSTPALCADSHSLGLFLDAVANCYRGKPAAAEEPLQYADLAAWLNELLESPPDDAGRQGPTEPTDLEALSLDGAGCTVSARLGPAGLAALERAASASRTDPAAVLLTCWQLLVAQLLGVPEVEVGVRCTGREHEELLDVLGPVGGPAVVAGGAFGDRTLAAVLAGVHQARREAERRQPYAPVDDEPAGRPVSFDYDDASGPVKLADGLALRVVARSVNDVRLGLRLSCLRRDEDLSVTVRASSLDEPAAGLLLDRLVDLVTRAAESLDLPAAAVDLLPADQRAEVLALSRSGSVDGETGCVHELFERQVRRSPDRPALVFGDVRLTYAETDVRANRLAHELRRRGAGPGLLVAVCAEPSADLVVAILAVWKAGAAYLPLPPGGPRERAEQQLSGAGVRLLIAGAAQLDGLPDLDTLCLGRDDASWQHHPPTPPQTGVTAADLAYAIYTSGSTGGPKGVLIEHRAVTCFRAAMREAVHGHVPPRRVAQNSALTFDASVQQLVSLLDGDTLYLLPEALRRDDRLLVEYVRAERLEVMNGTPSQIETLVAAGLVSPDAPHRPDRLLIAGEAVSAALWSELVTQAPGTAYNIYGPTEATVNATATPVDGTSEPSIGRPLPGYEVLVLDARLRPVPVGAPGELYLGGPALARGYLGAPALTAERFVPHPFATEPGARLYRTGDLGRWRADGQLEFLGRRDDQLKLRGYRIEPGEIADALRRHPEIRDAIVVVRDDRLVAYVVPAGEVAPGADELRVFLADRVPDYMVPAAFVSLAAFPLTTSGKLDRSALPAPDAGQPATGYAAPRTPAEQALAEIWSSVLRTATVGLDDNFFALGGDSIRAIRVRAQAAERGLDFSIQDLFESQTVRALAELAQAPVAEAAVDPLPAESDLPAGVTDAYPVTGTQAGMLFQDAYRPELALFRNTRTAHLRGPFDPAAARAALDAMAAAHPALRTSFDLLRDGEPWQLVHDSATVPLDVGDISHLPAAEQDAFIDAYCAEQRALPFDWSRPPFVRLALHRRGDDTFQATLTVHEAVLDGWSVALFNAELLGRYQAILSGNPSAEPAPRAAVRDAVAAERQAVLDPAEQAFWDDYLAGVPDGRLPRWGDGHGIHRITMVPVEPPTTEGLRALADELGLPLKNVLLAVHTSVLAELGGTAEVVTGLVANIRPEVQDGDRVLGQFLNTLPLRITPAGPTWADRARQAFDAERALLPHRRYPAAYTYRQLYDTAFNFTHFHAYQQGAGPDRLADDFFERTDLTLLADFSVDAETGDVRLTLNTTELSADQVALIAQTYADRLRAVGAGTPLTRISPESPAAGSADGDQVTALFEAQVRETPDAIAVVSGAERLTYAELNSRANRLARLLIAGGVRVETPVPLIADRGPDLVIGVLAVLKAGGAVLPLDAGDPPNRLGALLRRSGASLALVSGRDAVGGLDALAFDDQRLSTLDDTDLPPAAGPGNAAYVVATSGSTGEPKLVQVEHAALLNHLQAKAELLGLQSSDRVAVVVRPSFDIVFWQLLAPLLTGALVELLPDGVVHDLPQLIPALAARGSTIATVVPSQLEAILTDAPAPALRRLVVTGETLPPGLVASWLQRHPDTPVINAYGPAEAADNVSHHLIETPPTGPDCAIGVPIRNARLLVLDRSLAPVPTGVPGDLYIGGTPVARGYLDNPAATAAAFIPDPYVAGARLFRTGDRAYVAPDGVLHHLGRSDRQLKVHGVRVEPAEVERALAAHPTVDRAAVTAVEGRLVAFVTPAGAAERAGDLREHLLEVLPTAFLPARFVGLAALPTNSNGKIAWSALPGVDWSAGGGSSPSTELERTLAELWQGVLEIDPIGIHDDFFALGGDSIRAMLLCARIQHALGVEVSVRSLFAGPTIAALARTLEPPR